MKRTWKNIICGGALAALTAGAAVTGMDLFARNGEYPMSEEKDLSFGGYDEDKGFFQDGEDSFRPEMRERTFDFGENETGSHEEDGMTGATEKDSGTGSDSVSGKDSSDKASDGTQSDENAAESRSGRRKEMQSGNDQSTGRSKENTTETTAVAFTAYVPAQEPAVTERRGGFTITETRSSGINGYGVAIFILELLGIGLLGAWLIVSRGNRKTWGEVFHSRGSLPVLPGTVTLTEKDLKESRAQESGRTVSMDPRTVE